MRPKNDTGRGWQVYLGAGVIALLPAAATSQNLLTNPGFESGSLSPWTGIGSPLQLVSGDAFDGGFTARSVGRPANWGGHRGDITGLHPSGTILLFEGWVRLDGISEDQAMVKLRSEPVTGDPSSMTVARRPARPGEWTMLRGIRDVEYTGSQPDLRLYLHTRNNSEDFSADAWSVSVYEEDPTWRQLADAGVEQHRRRDVRISVVDVNGNPVGGQVSIQQTRHHFAFGATVEAPDLLAGNAQYMAVFPTLFEWATPRNALKWPASEWNRDVLNWERPDAAVNFCLDNDIRIYGHNIFWAQEIRLPPWAPALDNLRLMSEMAERVSDLLGRYGDVIDHWDVNNEMLHESYYLDRFGPSIREWMFSEAAAHDPGAKLYLNDYNVVGGGLVGGEGEAYLDHIQGFLDIGVAVAGVGAQCHFMDGPVVARWLRDRLDLLASAGLPVRLTEFDVVRSDVNERADDLEKFYRVAFSHPAVEGITLWGWWAGNHGQGPDAAIVDADFTINAAGQRYLDLLDEWTTSETLSSGRGGVVTMRGYHGTYEASITAAGYSSEPVAFELEPGPDVKQVTIVAVGNCLADVDASGVLDFFDVLAGLRRFDAGDMRFDLDASGVLDADDLQLFLVEFESGCP